MTAMSDDRLYDDRAHQSEQSRRRYLLEVRPLRESRLLLADEFYFAAHDPVSFKFRLSRPVLPLGLAAALVGEQLLADAIDIRGGVLWPQQPPPTDRDEVAHVAHRLIMEQRAVRSVVEWLEILSEHSHEWVVQRLMRERLLTLVEVRRLLRTVVVPKPVRELRVAAGVSRVASQLSSQRGLDVEDCLLVGLMAATSLTEYVFAETTAETRGVIQVRLNNLPARVPQQVRELIDATKAAAQRATLSGLG